MKVIDVVVLFSKSGLSVHSGTVRKWCREGTVKATKESRADGYVIDRESVEQLLEKKLKAEHERNIVFNKGYKKGFDDAKRIYKGEI